HAAHSVRGQQIFGCFLNDCFAVDDLPLALLQALISDGLQVIDIVEVDVLQTSDCRLDVPRHGNINQQQRTIPAEFYDRRQSGAVQNVVRRGSAANDDIDTLKFLRPFVKMDGTSIELSSQRFG